MPRATNSKLESQNLNLVGLLLTWFAKNARDLPWRRTSDPYAIWVSEIMLQQTQVKTVIPYWERWMRELPTMEALAKAKLERIHKLWEGLGYYTRVRNMQKAAQEICRGRGDESQINSSSTNGIIKHCLPSHPGSLPRGERETLSQVRKNQRAPVQSDARSALNSRNHSQNRESAGTGVHKFPNTFQQVLALPGIGRYTAGAICSIAFNQPTPILDGNVMRVLTRVFGIAENPKDKKANAHLWNLAEQLVLHASRFTHHASPCSHLNQSLMELGALICTPREPKCLVCPIAKHCFAFQNNRVAEFPNLEKRAATTARRFAAFVVENDGKFLVRQRPAGVVNAHLWEFPNIELNGASVAPSVSAKDLLGFTPREVKALCTIKHSITRYRITMEAYRAAVPTSYADHLKAELQTSWLPLSKLHKLSFPSAHKKILTALKAS